MNRQERVSETYEQEAVIYKGKQEVVSRQESVSDDLYDTWDPVKDEEKPYLNYDRHPYPQKDEFWKLEKIGIFMNPVYCAPEVLTKGWRGTSSKSDIWSVGLILWQVIARGRKLFESFTDEEELLTSLKFSRDFVRNNLLSPDQFEHSCKTIPDCQLSMENHVYQDILRCFMFNPSERVDTFSLMRSFLKIRTKVNMFGKNVDDLQLWNCEFSIPPDTDKQAVLGKGNFSSVKKGEWMIKGNEVAIKTMKRNTNINVGENLNTEYFVKEVQILKNVSHENIIEMYGYLSSNTDFSIVFELFGTTDLKKALKRNEIKRQFQLMEIMTQVARGIKYLHEKKILHLDLATRNILINFVDDIVTSKIIDFGLAIQIAGNHYVK